MQKERMVVFVVFIAVALLPAITVHATDMDTFTLEELCEESTDIVRGTILSVKSFHPDGDTSKIFSSVWVTVDEYMQGSLETGTTFEMIVCGGTMGKYTTRIVDGPNFIVGQQSIMFLKEYTSDYFGRNYSVYGLSQGKFNVTDKTVTRESLAPLQREKNGEYLPVSVDTSMDVDKFEEAILDMVKY